MTCPPVIFDPWDTRFAHPLLLQLLALAHLSCTQIPITRLSSRMYFFLHNIHPFTKSIKKCQLHTTFAGVKHASILHLVWSVFEYTPPLGTPVTVTHPPVTQPLNVVPSIRYISICCTAVTHPSVVQPVHINPLEPSLPIRYIRYTCIVHYLRTYVNQPRIVALEL